MFSLWIDDKCCLKKVFNHFIVMIRKRCQVSRISTHFAILAINPWLLNIISIRLVNSFNTSFYQYSMPISAQKGNVKKNVIQIDVAYTSANKLFDNLLHERQNFLCWRMWGVDEQWNGLKCVYIFQRESQPHEIVVQVDIVATLQAIDCCYQIIANFFMDWDIHHVLKKRVFFPSSEIIFVFEL